MCKLDEILSKENYFEKSFLIDAHLISQNRSFSLCSLIDSDSVIYMIIHSNLVDKVCEKLKIQSISLTKEKLIRDYDEKISKKIITHKILLNLIIESHKKLTVSMLIADIDHHEVILSKLWMNKNEILLNMRNDVIVFPNQLNTSISIFSISLNSKHSSWSQSTSSSSTTQTKTSMMLKRLVRKESFSIWSIDAASFKTLLNHSKKNKIEVFALFMTNINREIAYNTQNDLNALNISSIDETAQDLKDIKAKLPSKYHEFLDVFDRAQSNKLSSHRFYDHKIELISDSTPPRCRAYRMSSAKLLKVKKYLNENLSKEFITSSQAPYFFPVLFALKANEDLRFCVNYRKLNVIFKRNRYSLSLIDEIIDKIVGCKHLTRLNILSKFNFQIIFRSGKTNTKVDALTRMPLANVSEPAQRLEDRFQTILTSDRVDVLSIEPEANLYQRVWMINQTDELCSEYRQAMNENKLKFHTSKLKDCEIIDGVLFRKGLLWISENMHTELLQEVHDQSSISHPDNRRIIDLVQRFYYWSGHRATIRRYIRNCHACQRSKVSRNSTNGLHHPLPISQERWKDIAMNFITELSLSEGYNAICTIICRLTKERHYVSCHWEDDDISAEETVWIMLWNVYRLHGLFSSIVSDRGSQFISTMWKSLCKRLRITASLFTVYHSKIDDQSERVNQDVERELRIYCNYMQNDWAKWIPMVKFSDNFNIFSITSMIFFYFNKEFHSRMSFDSDTTDYETTRERLEARKADDIAIRMKELLNFGRQQLKKTKLIIEVQINKHRRNVIYEVDDWVWLSFRNVKTTRLCKDLKDKQLGLYQITAKVSTFYHLRLPVSMKHLHSMFSPKLLRPYSEDPLPEQHSESLRLITIEDDEHWKIDDILNFRRYRGRIQYKVKWTDLDRNDEWYYADKGEFDDSEKVLNEFHKLYSNKPR